MIEPAFFGRARISDLAGIGKPATLRVGGVAEVIFNPGRDNYSVRTGPAVTLHLGARPRATGARSVIEARSQSPSPQRSAAGVEGE